MKLAIKSTLDLPKVVFGTYELEHAATQADQGCSIVGSFWVEDPEEAWMDGEVVEVNGEDITVNSASGKMVSSFRELISSFRVENILVY
ncbi:hypothetical protein OIU76_011258 [Salix suchowensis]|nr:hypothetical protein OIU76_011258 [Salix suchowensis]KAJ6356322.1 hypothetical protein OIU78_004434 [Salix suchowensis]